MPARVPPEVTPPTAPSRGAEECGRSTARAPLPLASKPPILLAKIAVVGPHREGWIFPRGVVDMPAGASLYNDYSARRRLGALARLRSSSLIFGDKASDPNRRRRTSTALRLTEGGTASVPGCLIGESEERETWTAESLRAASSIGDLSPIAVRPGRDFGGRRFRSTPWSAQTAGACDAQSRVLDCAREPEWDLVKRCDRPGKVLIQLESLILAQSERWRQA